MTSRLERLLADALHDAGATTEPSDELFARIQIGIESDRRRRHTVRRLAWSLFALVIAAGSVVAILVYRQGEPEMDWWILELFVFVLLTVIALVLGPFIKRFGRSYAADVFRSNPATGKSFIVLTDFAYYLIFSAYILFTTVVDRPPSWPQNVGAEQVERELVRIGGILLIIGLLHGLNLIVLPVIGRLLTLNRRLDQQMREASVRELDRDGSQEEGQRP